MNWTDNSFHVLGLFQIIFIILIFITIIIGFVSALKASNTSLLITFLIFLLISFTFTLSQLIFTFSAMKIRYWNESLGCNTQFKGLFQAWNSIDIYLQAVDEIFCSKKCPCYLNRTTSIKFLQNSLIAPYYNLWFISEVKNPPKKFQDCGEVEYNQAFNNYLMRNAYFKYTLIHNKFEKYFGFIEKKFKCTGFCGLNYYNENTLTNSKIVKYLFSDVNNVPENFGCFEQILQYLKRNLFNFGILLILLFISQLLLLILIIYYYNISIQTKKNDMNVSKSSSMEQIKNSVQNSVIQIINLKQNNQIKMHINSMVKNKLNDSKKNNQLKPQGSFTPTSSQKAENRNISFLPSYTHS